MRKFFKTFSNWYGTVSSPSEKRVISVNSYENSQNHVKYGQKFSFNSPSDQKKPNSSMMDVSFDNLDPKSIDRPSMGISDYLVAFSGFSKSYCVGIVDMVGSTKISAGMNEISWSRFYGIFLNSLAKILPRFGGTVIKNQGDSLLYYFPESASATKISFLKCLEGNFALIDEHDSINKVLHREGLPPLDYRVSVDYGKVILMKSNNSSCLDLIGPPVNMCAKINHAASKNGIAIGGDLYTMVRGFNGYKFKEVKGFSLGFKQAYPIFSLERKRLIYEKS